MPGRLPLGQIACLGLGGKSSPALGVTPSPCILWQMVGGCCCCPSLVEYPGPEEVRRACCVLLPAPSHRPAVAALLRVEVPGVMQPLRVSSSLRRVRFSGKGVCKAGPQPLLARVRRAKGTCLSCGVLNPRSAGSRGHLPAAINPSTGSSGRTKPNAVISGLPALLAHTLQLGRMRGTCGGVGYSTPPRPLLGIRFTQPGAGKPW